MTSIRNILQLPHPKLFITVIDGKSTERQTIPNQNRNKPARNTYSWFGTAAFGCIVAHKRQNHRRMVATGAKIYHKALFKPQHSCDNDLDRSASFDVDELSEPKPFQRKVRFSLLEDVKFFTRHPLQRDEDLYWSDKEREQFLVLTRQDCAGLRSNLSGHAHALETAYQNCGDRTLPASHLQQDMQVMFDWAKSNGRGLERAVSSGLRSRRRLVVQEIVRRHQYLVAVNSKAESADDMLRDLSALSKRKTRLSREFAYKMALSDANSICA
jgi:hypothetical protein